MVHRPLFLAALAALSFPAFAQEPAAGDARLLRMPDVSATHIVFVRGGDLYVVPRAGGMALQLTQHAGQELHPKFSPDGRWIAYSAEYDGTRQVYVIPSGGGTARQLTYRNDTSGLPPRGGTDNRPLDWTPDGREVIVRMNRLAQDDRAGRAFRVPFAGGMETPLPMAETGGGSLSPDGTKFVYTPVEADWRGWKRYRGGRAPDLWVYDMAAKDAKRITDFAGMDMQPAWVGDTIYFASDRDYTLNLYAIAPAGGEPKKLTQFDDFDVLWPSGGPDAVVFEQGGWIWRYDVGAAEAVRVPIRLAGDAPQAMPAWKKAAEFVESFSLSPKGERAVFAARGELFTVPAKHGEPRNVSNTPGEREISVTWSPDGKTLAYLSDASGEYEIYVRNQDGTGTPRRVTRDGDIWRYPPVWSPDSKKLAFADKHVKLRWVDVASGTVHDVDQSSIEDITEYTWSPDSNWIAYAKTNATRMQGIWVHSLSSGKSSQLTGDLSNAFTPAFDPKGRYLYFLSARDYGGLTFSGYEFNYLYANPTRIYAATLAADGPALNRPKSDEVAPADAAAPAGEGKDKGKGKDDAKASTPTVRIDVAGFDARTVALNAPAGNYQGLTAVDEGVLVASGNPQQGPLTLQFVGLEAEKPADVVAGITGYALSADGTKVLARQGNDFAIIDAKPAQPMAEVGKAKLALDRMDLFVDPRVEWPQLYTDAWRILRDWFYDPQLHGGRERWDTLRARYQPLVASAATRQDLDYVLHELAGELNAGHVYVNAGDELKVERKAGGLLGAEFSRDGSGFYKIDEIFPGNNWDAAFRSPLTEAGVDVKPGDYLIAIDGRPTRDVANVFELLRGRGDRVVTLTVNGRPSADGARTLRVKTITSELNLRYLRWVAERRAMVDRLSGGRIGYIHVPNTAVEGNRELNRWLAPMAHKDALIIDDRYNGGGYIPDRMIELLARTPLNYWKRRGLDPQATPQLSHVGPKAMLINGYSSSGGDALPYYFKKLKLGPLIGTRTWGGLIGISGNPGLADGGAILAATFRFMDTDNRWAVENEGVAPDIEVIDAPHLVAAGRDPSLERAVAELLKTLEQSPARPVKAPPEPQVFGRD